MMIKGKQIKKPYPLTPTKLVEGNLYFDAFTDSFCIYIKKVEMKDGLDRELDFYQFFCLTKYETYKIREISMNRNIIEWL